MMRKFISFIFVLGFIAAVDAYVSHANGSPQWVTGEVVSIVENLEAGLISLRMPGGELVSITSGHDLLKGIKTGDIVTVQIVEGWAQIIQVAKSGIPEKPAPEKKETGAQWVPGEVVSIQEGETDSMLSIKMSDGTIFNVAASNDKIQGVNVGDQVIAKVHKGWAQSVSKKEN